MPKQGTINNPKGRPIGTQNRVNADLRQRIAALIESNFETIEADIQALEPKDRLQFLEKLLKYTLPTLQATSLNLDFEKLTDEQLDEIINRLTKTYTNE